MEEGSHAVVRLGGVVRAAADENRAAPRSILSGILGEGLVLALIGIGAGLLAALALTRYLATLLYTVRPTDPLVYFAVTSILIAAALSGCYFPARRATRVDPASVLRVE